MMVEFLPELAASLGARTLRWCRQWYINNRGKGIALEELEEDRRELWDMGFELDGFDLTSDLALPDLIQEYGQAYAEEKMGPVSIIEEIF